MPTWSDIATEVQGETRKIPHAAFRRAAHRGAILTCTETRVWKVAMEPVPLTQRRYIYDLAVPDGADPVEGTDLQLLTRPRSGAGATSARALRPVSRSDALAGREGGVPPAWPDSGAEALGTPSVWMEWRGTGGERQIAVAPTPDAAFRYSVRGEICLTPSAGAETLPDDIYGIIRPVLRRAIFWDLYSQPDQTWSSNRRADYFRSEYLSRRNRLLASRGLAVKQRRFVRANYY